MRKSKNYFILFILFTLFNWAKAYAEISEKRPPLSLTLYGDSDKTLATKITSPYIEFRLSKREENTNLGLSFASKNMSPLFPFVIKAGNLSGSGSLSKLNNPAISNGTSPFSSGISYPGITKASLPGYSSFSNPTTVFFQLGIPNLLKKTSSLELSCFFPKNFASPLSSLLFSSSLFDRSLLLKFNSTAGLFTYDDNLSSSWFSDEPYYLAGNHLCSMYQFSIELNPKSKRLLRFNLPDIYFSNTLAFYEFPNDTIPLCLRSEIKITSKHTESFIIAFYNPKDAIFTSSEKKLSSCLQVKGGFLIKSIMQRSKEMPLFIKTGLNIHSTFNLLQTEHPLRINAGIQVSSSMNTLSLTGSVNLSLNSVNNKSTIKSLEYSGLTLQIKDSMYFKYLIAALSASATFTPSKTEEMTSKYKFTLNMTNKASQKINGNTSLALSAKNGEVLSKKITGALSLLLKYKWLNFSGKISADFDF